jgi:hypothetical protein
MRNGGEDRATVCLQSLQGADMGIHYQDTESTAPLIRPRLMIEAARKGARLYRRARDLPDALAGSHPHAALGSSSAILARLTEVEWVCEDQRRSRSPAYRPGRHVQVLAALLAEAENARVKADQVPANQAKASGSEALRLAI